MTAAIRTLALLVAAIFVVAAPAATQPLAPPEDMRADGAYRAGAFIYMPDSVYVDVRLLDDSPDNVRLRDTLVGYLERLGLRRSGAPRFVLTLEFDRTYVVERGESGGRRPAGLWGVVRALLDEAATGTRFWEAEAIYRSLQGDTVTGAFGVMTVLAQSVGDTVETEALVLY